MAEGKRPGPGRPTLYTPELADEICARLAKGETLRSICRTEGFPSDACVRWWVIDNFNGFAPRYHEARQLGLDVMAEELLEISDDMSRDRTVDENGKRVVDHEHINRSRLRVDTRKWYLSKLAPKRYGEKVSVEATGSDGAPLVIVTGVPRGDKSDG